MADARFSMSVSELMAEARVQAFIAEKSKGAKRRAAFVRLDDLVRTAGDYVVLGIPEPRPQSHDHGSES